MFKRQSRVDYSRLVEEEDDTIHHHELLHSHPHSVLVANHHGQCNVVPPLVQQQAQQHHNANNNNMKAPRSSFSVPDATRRFFQTKLPIAFGKDMGSTAASFSSLPPVIIADFQSGNLPEFGSNEDETQVGDQGWVIVHRRRFKGKHGIGETRHQADTDEVLDEEIDPSDQVTCSVFVKWEPDTSTHTTAITQPQPYTMTSPVYDKSSSKKAEDDERVSKSGELTIQVSYLSHHRTSQILYQKQRKDTMKLFNLFAQPLKVTCSPRASVKAPADPTFVATVQGKL